MKCYLEGITWWGNHHQNLIKTEKANKKKKIIVYTNIQDVNI